LVAITVLGCGGSSSEGPSAPTSPREEIVAVVERYESALADRDADEICSEVLAPSMFAPEVRATRCESRLQATLESGGELAKAPSLDIESVEIRGHSATARLLAGGFLQLSRERGQWYVELSF
jgi:hypothetical protein